jgi:hypothetical protein
MPQNREDTMPTKRKTLPPLEAFFAAVRLRMWRSYHLRVKVYGNEAAIFRGTRLWPGGGMIFVADERPRRRGRYIQVNHRYGVVRLRVQAEHLNTYETVSWVTRYAAAPEAYLLCDEPAPLGSRYVEKPTIPAELLDRR